MIGIIVDVLAVALGGLLGTVFGKKMSQKFANQLNLIFGVCAASMGVGAIMQMQNMPAVILAVVVGSAIGLATHFGALISRGGQLLEKPVKALLGDRAGGKGVSREEFISSLVTVIVIFCTSGTGIYGSLDAGMSGNITILLAKAVLDFFTAMVFACNLGAVVAFVAIPQFIIFGILFLLARVIYPLTTPVMINDFRACGGILLLATGFRMAKMREFPIADMTPALIVVMPLSALWTNVIAPLL